MKVFIGTDHRGHELKKEIKNILQKQRAEIEDLSKDYSPKDDYPVIANHVAHRVSQTPGAKGIVVCGSGAGVDIVANKTDGVRSVLAISPEQVAVSRKDDNTNILSLAADFTDLTHLEEILTAFLTTEYIPNARHERRLDEIRQIENEK